MKRFVQFCAGSVAAVLALALINWSQAACSGNGQPSPADLDTVYAPRYASGFLIRSHGDGSLIDVYNPWQQAEDVTMQVFVARRGSRPPAGFEGTVVNAPLKKVVCMSSSYIAYIDALGCVDAVTGVSGIKFVYNAAVRSRYEQGRIIEVGYEAGTNIEAIAAMQPDIVFVYGVNGENPALTGRLAELGIPYFYVGEYVEHSPLGKAEWLMFFAEFFDRRESARETFGKVESDYGQVKEILAAADIPEEGRPTVMLNTPFRDIWYVPGDRNYMARFIEEAGGIYACAGSDTEQSRPISSEAAYKYARDAEVWLNPGQCRTLSDIRVMDSRFVSLPAFRNGDVFNCTARSTPQGGSDFWESAAVRPDLVLKDLGAIFHPRLFPGHQLYYYERLP